MAAAPRASQCEVVRGGEGPPQKLAKQAVALWRRALSILAPAATTTTAAIGENSGSGFEGLVTPGPSLQRFVFIKMLRQQC